MNSPEKVLDGLTDYPNRHNRYWLWNPVVFGGWPARWEPFRKEFGVVDLTGPQTNGELRNFEYVVLAGKPHLVFERYDESLLKSARRTVEFKDVVVLELSKP